MPWKPPSVCPQGHPPFRGRGCPACARTSKRAREGGRPGARRRGYDRAWERESKAFLALPENRICVCGCGQLADMVDHRIAPKGDMRLFWDRDNWRPMNSRCNSRKCVLTEGGFGNRIAS